MQLYLKASAFITDETGSQFFIVNKLWKGSRHMFTAW